MTSIEWSDSAPYQITFLVHPRLLKRMQFLSIPLQGALDEMKWQFKAGSELQFVPSRFPIPKAPGSKAAPAHRQHERRRDASA
jgi:hypothetical protein